MEPELFHLWETANQPGGAILIAGVIGAILVGCVCAYLLYRRRIGPVLLWLILFLFFFGFSQMFPENRSQCRQLGIMTAIGSCVLTWVIVRVIRKHNQSQKKCNVKSD
jgi:sugar phosphate permease